MKDDEITDFILETVYLTDGKLSDAQIIHDLIAAKDVTALARISFLTKYLEAIELIKIINTMGYGLRYQLTPKAIQILHEHVSYSKYKKREKSFFNKLTLFEKLSIVYVILSSMYFLYSELKSNSKDKEIARIKNDMKEQTMYIERMRNEIKHKDEIIELYNRTVMPPALEKIIK